MGGGALALEGGCLQIDCLKRKCEAVPHSTDRFERRQTHQIVLCWLVYQSLCYPPVDACKIHSADKRSLARAYLTHRGCLLVPVLSPSYLLQDYAFYVDVLRACPSLCGHHVDFCVLSFLSGWSLKIAARPVSLPAAVQSPATSVTKLVVWALDRPPC